MQQARDAVAAAPGVQAVALASGGPLFGGGDTDGLVVDGRPALPPEQAPTVEWFDIDERYFATLGVRLVRGRALTASDARGAPDVAVVNEALARRFFPGEDPIGRRVTAEQHPSEIVGVVADVRPMRPDEPVAPQIYWPIQQFRRGAAYLVIRAVPSAAALEPSVAARVAAVDPGIDLGPFVTLDDRVARNLVRPRFTMLLIACFAVLAVALSAIGVYGVVAYGVARRTREFGVRLALGATPRTVSRHVVTGGLALVALGLGLGGTAALGLGRVLTSLLYGVPPTDAPTLAGAAALLGAIATVACWIPARRAARVDPVTALRAE
jgi:predicted permease